MRQSDRQPAYDAALKTLATRGLTYHCTCTRADIRAALSAPQEGIPGPDGPVYPGTCRAKGHREGAIRLDMTKATAEIGTLSYSETVTDPGTRHADAALLIQTIGDVVLARRDVGTSYHLAVVVDDAAQGVTEVTRGEDMAAATPIHVLLQRLLDLPTPAYHHHRLIRDETGKRLAKRDDARALSKYRAERATPGDIRLMLGLAP